MGGSQGDAGAGDHGGKNVKQEGGRARRGHSHVSDEQGMKLALEIIVPVFLSGSFRTPPFFSNRPVAGKIEQF